VADLYGQFLAEAGITAPDGKLDYNDFAKYSRACAPKRPLGSGGSTPSRSSSISYSRAVDMGVKGAVGFINILLTVAQNATAVMLLYEDRLAQSFWL